MRGKIKTRNHQKQGIRLLRLSLWGSLSIPRHTSMLEMNLAHAGSRQSRLG